MKYKERLQRSPPTYVAFEDLQKVDYPQMFKEMPSEKRTDIELKAFVKMCEYIKKESYKDKMNLPHILFAVEKDAKVWFFELQGVQGVGSPLELITPLLKLFNPNLFVVIAESWMKKLDKGDKEKYNYGEISKDADKTEALILDGRTREGKKFCKFFEMKRDNDMVKLIDLEHKYGEGNTVKTKYDMEPEK